MIKPYVICVQETSLKHHLDFVLQDYIIIQQDREKGNDGGCATLVRQDIEQENRKMLWWRCGTGKRIW